MKISACVFCDIQTKLEGHKILYQDEQVIAIRDIHPIAPVHILIIPRKHIGSINEIEMQDEPLLGHMLVVAKQLAALDGVAASGYRLVFNTGLDAGQTVQHLHLHVIGGRELPFHFR